MSARWLFLSALVLAAGCGTSKFAPVSGRVTLNGKPLANAQIAFNPIPPEGKIESGPTAIGTTDQNGEFTLQIDMNQMGAVVGKHRVMISAMSSQAAADNDAPVAPGGAPRNIVPARYNGKTELTCDVPVGGKHDANFELKSP